MLPRTIAAFLLFGFSAVPALADEAPLRAYYAGYARGFNVLNLETALTLHPADYRLTITYHLAGVVGALVHGDATTTVDGRFVGGRAEPRELFSQGRLRGDPRVTQIDWQDGSPKVLQMLPAVETERDPVPASEQAHTIDTLSAMVVLMRQVTDSGRCEGAMRTFDGRRLSEISAHTVGQETLEQTSRSSFQGPALRCDFAGRQLGGFLRDDDQVAIRKPQQGSAWFARLQPGQPFIPVRIDFTARLLGTTTLYLTPAPQ